MKKQIKTLLLLLFVAFIMFLPIKTFAADKSIEGWYKTEGYYKMRPEGEANGKVIVKIPPGATIHVIRKDKKISTRVIAEYNGKTGSILSANLVKTTAPTSNDTGSTTATTTSSKNTTTKKTTTATITTTNGSNTQSYKTKFKLAMRNDRGDVIKSIPAKSIIQVIGKDPKNKNRVIATFKGKTGSVLNSGLVKISTTNSNTSNTNATTATTNTTTQKTTTKENSNQSKYKYFARITAKSNLIDKNGKKIKELKPNEFVKVISISSDKAKVEWYDKTGFVPKKNIKQTDNAIFISIEKQTQTLLKNGEILVTTPIVTGCTANKKDTPKGTFYIKDMKKIKNNNPVTLTGTNSDGTKYTSYVDYWMRITDSGVGIHDANRWRSKYGGTIYKTNGSHGCINTPKSAMKTIYENSYVGLSVYIQ